MLIYKKVFQIPMLAKYRSVITILLMCILCFLVFDIYRSLVLFQNLSHNIIAIFKPESITLILVCDWSVIGLLKFASFLKLIVQEREYSYCF